MHALDCIIYNSHYLVFEVIHQKMVLHTVRAKHIGNAASYIILHSALTMWHCRQITVLSRIPLKTFSMGVFPVFEAALR